MATMKTKSAPRAQNDKVATSSDAVAPTSHVGEVLRLAREERDITLDMVADELMIRRFYLDALENGVFHDLPERVYATGFVKNYANYLGLDSRALIEQFKRDAYGSRHGLPYQVTLNMPEPVVHSVVPGRSAMVTAVVVLGVLIAGVVWMTQKSHTAIDTIPEPAPVAQEIVAPEVADIPVPAAPAVSNENPVAPAADAANAAANPDAVTGFVSAADASAVAATTDAVASDAAVPATDSNAAQTTSAVAPTVEAAAAPSTETVSAPAASTETPVPAITVKNHRVLEAIQSSWVEVRDEKNTILFTSILKTGQILPLPDGARLNVTTGNAGGLRMLIDGKPQPVFGQPNEVKRNMVIAPRPLDRH